ncbi:phosphoribosylaminoimidazole carboxylase [Tieghemostelium lacteum]|uniref:Phosphoribosylaminoimidazole carboxylase n=1 Tax=Tieghemostelium lacteum TaxID=361077 RepID=A0A151ZA62_TIELA|nr:phosphoribosylaminoimidazole carboxylase [Tieghemostelium lacteum]|eukprot:KYQ90835.1 phosphoribosylaminoimidazole carboxylase [Tieghemostelium lacteum]
MSSSSIKINDINDVTFLASGKTKTIYQLNKDDQYVLIESNSSITAGDGAKKDTLPNKDLYSTTTTCNVYKTLQIAGVETHFVRQERPNAFIAKRCAMIPLEVIVRRLATGSYLKRNPQVAEGTRFSPCLTEFTFKDDSQHDPLVTEHDILEMNLKIGGIPITTKVLSQIRHIATQSFEVLERAWKSLDVVLVDFKVEFGVSVRGELILADVIDNDSWRIWPHGDKSQMKDKQVYRNTPIQSSSNTETNATTKVNTLTNDQISQIESNYRWVADQTQKLYEFTQANPIQVTPSRYLNINNNYTMSPSSSSGPNSPMSSQVPIGLSNSNSGLGSHLNSSTNNTNQFNSNSSSSSIHYNPSTSNNNICTTTAAAKNEKVLVGVIMGSQSDWETMKHSTNTLTTLGIPFECKIVSAHRTPDRLYEYAKTAKSRGLRVIIAGAGGAAHLPGMVAALTSVPVFGVPIQSKALSGVDSLLSIVQMPAGIPVGTVAIGVSGAVNAALLAASVLAPYHSHIDSNLEAYRKKQTDAVNDSPVDLPSSHDTISHNTSNISTILSVGASQQNIPVIHQPQPQQPQSQLLNNLNNNNNNNNNNNINNNVARVSSPLPITPPTPMLLDKQPMSTYILSSIRSSGLVLPPGSTIGILGGGQLARMTAIAAAQLGYKTHVYCPEPEPSAGHVSTHVTRSAYNSYADLDRFAQKVDVITYEFENIMCEPVEYLSRKVAVFPDPKILKTCQDRVLEKTFVQSCGIPTARFEPVDSLDMLRGAIKKLGYPSILKSNTMGYDGKGQVKIVEGMDLEQAWKTVTQNITSSIKAILEEYIEFESEGSVIVARGLDTNCEQVTYPLVQNKHKNHILRQTIAPSPLPDYIHQEAKEISKKISKSIHLVGILAIELFIVKDKQSGNYRLLVNELAPRPHNSGHWTIEGCATSQFEQLVRCICGLSLGCVDFMKRVPEQEYISQKLQPIIMNNLLGQDVDQWEKQIHNKSSHLHIYAKGDAKEGRKMGHVTILPGSN